jgi:hypothetical protein
MKPSEDLFKLIKSLTKSEKRYFKRFSMLHNSDKKNNYLKLFNAIDKQKVYNEKRIKEEFIKERFVKQLSVVKDYLQKNILKSLSSFTSTTDPYIITKDYITEAEILMHRKLFQSSWKKIQKAKELSYKYGYYFVLIEAIGDERLLLKLLKNNISNVTLEKLIIEEESVLNEILRIRKYLKFNHIIMNRIYSLGSPIRDNVELEKMKLIITEMNNSDCENAFSSQSISLFNHTNIFFNIAACNYNLSKEYSLKLKEYLEENPEIIKNDPTNYFWCLYNIALLSIRTNNLLCAEKYLLLLVDFIISGKFYSTTRNRNEMRLNYDCLRIIFNNKMGRSLVNLVIIEELVKYGLSNIKETDGTDYLIMNITLTYLLLLKWSDALKWINYIIEGSKITIYKDASYILNLIIHYELRNYDYLDSLLTKTAKHFKGYSKTRYENTFIKNFRHLLKTNESSKVKLIFQRLKFEIEPYLDYASEKEILDEYYILNWINLKTI